MHVCLICNAKSNDPDKDGWIIAGENEFYCAKHGEEMAQIAKIEWWDDEQDEQMQKILDKAHKAEAKKHGVKFKFYARSEGCFGSPRIYSDTDPGVGFWTGVNPYTLEAHHLWYPCSDAEMDAWHDLINSPPRMN